MNVAKPPSAFLVACGIVTIFFFPVMIPLVSPRHLTVYHQQGPAWRFFLPILIDALVFAFLLSMLVRLTRTRQTVRLGLWTLAVSLLPILAVKTFYIETGTMLPSSLGRALLFLSMLGFVLLLWLARRSPADKMASLLQQMELGAALLAWSGIFLFGQALWFLHAAGNRVDPPLSHVAVAGATLPPVIWILFDELSEDQLYEHRFPGLPLPAFDRFAAQSTQFSQTLPTNLYTEAAVPALLTGLPISQIEAASDGIHLTLDLRSGARQPVDPQQTVFGDARRIGYVTSVDGWFNPYCRTFASVLDHCIWTAHRNTIPGGFRTEGSFGENVAAPVSAGISWLGRLFSSRGERKKAGRSRCDHIDEYRAIEAAARPLLATPYPGFVFLHVPAPHPEGIFNRHTGRLSGDKPSSYVDNLALADRFLGEVQDALTAAHTWDQATVVVMGDHSWRTRQMWYGSPIWTTEDDTASHHGTFDPRPAYLVKLPNQHVSARFDQPFDALRNRALFDKLLAGQIQTQEQLTGWASHP